MGINNTLIEYLRIRICYLLKVNSIHTYTPKRKSCCWTKSSQLQSEVF